MPCEISDRFPLYEEFISRVPVWCVTPDRSGCFHRFFDSSPISPSGRYLAVTRMDNELRVPTPGEPAEIVVVDLLSGESAVVATTYGWDTQLGAQVQWGADDRQLFFNDMDLARWQPFGKVIDPLGGDVRRINGTVYMVSPDGKWSASPCLLRTGVTQPGYGVQVPPGRPPINRGAARDDGLYMTDTATGHCRLVASFARIVSDARPRLDPAEYANGDFYGFHVRWNRQGTRLQFVVRWKPRAEGKIRSNLITLRPDGSEIRVAIPASEWIDKGGHHPSWQPDGEHVMMNLNIAGEGLRLVGAKYDGTEYGALHPTALGSGHPSLHPNGRTVVTDAYTDEPVAFGDGTTPIRVIDLVTGDVDNIIRIQTRPDYEGPRKELRVDPHPAWDRGFTRIAFNACPYGRRHVYVADLTDYLAAVS